MESHHFPTQLQQLQLTHELKEISLLRSVTTAARHTLVGGAQLLSPAPYATLGRSMPNESVDSQAQVLAITQAIAEASNAGASTLVLQLRAEKRLFSTVHELNGMLSSSQHRSLALRALKRIGLEYAGLSVVPKGTASQQHWNDTSPVKPVEYLSC